MNKKSQFLVFNFVLIFTLFFANKGFSDVEFSFGVPNDLPEFEQTYDLNGEETPPIDALLDSEIYGQSVIDDVMSSWFDDGYGPGRLTYQYQWFYSSVLKPGYSPYGYMSKVAYKWKGDFYGWKGVYVYLYFYDHYGNYVGYADVTSSRSGKFSVPAHSIPANYRMRYGYIVNKKPKRKIYNGPVFKNVHVKVYY